MNQCVISGYVGKDPVERQNGIYTIVAFPVGVNGKNGKTEWFSVSIFTKTEKHLAYARHIKKGSPITVSGPVSLNTYEKNGVRYSNLQITAIDVFFPSTKSNAGADDGSNDVAQSADIPVNTAEQAVLQDEGYDPFADQA